MDLEYIISGENKKISCHIEKDTCSAELAGEKHRFDFSFLGDNLLNLRNESGNQTVYFARNKDGIHLFIAGEKFFIRSAVSESKFAGIGSGYRVAKGLVTAPMPGTIIKILVSEGDIVEKDQGLVIVEAMKMENEIRATFKAKVKKINFKPGDAVDVGKSIIDLEEILAIPGEPE